MLAKMGRIALLAEELGRRGEAQAMAQRLSDILDVWLDGSRAASPLLYDVKWGGVVACGCYFNYESEDGCYNGVSGAECPGLTDLGQNFGQGFYQDHHFHFGYHIYAAAVVAHFLPETARSQWDRVLLLVRDVANPSASDPWFPQWRHKDWFLGSSWASGIVKWEWGPDPHGRNQESISEAGNAYDAIALYGQEMAKAFELLDPSSSKSDTSTGVSHAAIARRVRDTGRVMVATEIASAQAFWQVCHDTNEQGQITPCALSSLTLSSPTIPVANQPTYPSGYAPNVVGQIWSTSAEMQTWFGSAAWKVSVTPFVLWRRLINVPPYHPVQDTTSCRKLDARV